MLETTVIIAIIGLATLAVERIASWSLKIKKSTCCKGAMEIEMKDSQEIKK